MNINKSYAQLRYNVSRKTGRAVKYIVVHYTGTSASAENNCKYFGTGNRNASADYFINKNGSVFQFNADTHNYYSWHCGGGSSYGPMNNNSIGIEVVSAGEDFSVEQINALTELIAMLRKEFGISADNVVRHYDCNSIRKLCPYPYINAQKWADLKKRITSGQSSSVNISGAPAPKPVVPVSQGGKIAEDGKIGNATIKALQQGLGTGADGIISGQYSKYRQYWTSIVGGCPWNGGKSAVVSALQKKAGIKNADGILGKDTATKVQTMLKNKGFDPGTIDGYFGTNSAKALQRWINAGCK